MGVIMFNGKSSRDYGIIVEEYPALNHGARRGDAYQIAGRNGTFYDEDGTYDNYVQAYNVAIREGRFRRADLRASDLASWLLGTSGFCRLEDSFEPEYFKMARFAGPLNIAQIMGRYGRCTIEFDCLPERWLKSGEEPIVSYNSYTVPAIFNPTGFASKPLIKLYGGTGLLSLTVNNIHYLDVSGQGSSGPVVIDCDSGTVIDGSGNNIMGTVTFYGTYNELPIFKSGANTVELNTNVTGYEIVPRWWTL